MTLTLTDTARLREAVASLQRIAFVEGMTIGTLGMLIFVLVMGR